MRKTNYHFITILSFMRIVTGLMPGDFSLAISTHFMKIEQFLLEDSEVASNRHCDWIFMKDNEVEGAHGKLLSYYRICHSLQMNYDLLRFQGYWTIGQVIHDSQPPTDK